MLRLASAVGCSLLTIVFALCVGNFFLLRCSRRRDPWSAVNLVALWRKLGYRVPCTHLEQVPFAFCLYAVRHELNFLYGPHRTCYSHQSTSHRFLIPTHMLLCFQDIKIFPLLAYFYFFFCRFFRRDTHVARQFCVGLRSSGKLWIQLNLWCFMRLKIKTNLQNKSSVKFATNVNRNICAKLEPLM